MLGGCFTGGADTAGGFAVGGCFMGGGPMSAFGGCFTGGASRGGAFPNVLVLGDNTGGVLMRMPPGVTGGAVARSFPHRLTAVIALTGDVSGEAGALVVATGLGAGGGSVMCDNTTGKSVAAGADGH